jgi:hypothetical protein
VKTYIYLKLIQKHTWLTLDKKGLQSESAGEKSGLKRTLGARSLVALGIGAIIRFYNLFWI